jgi:hypothetical protein
MTRSIVTWINSGFEGSPAFATDLEAHMQQLGDAVVMSFLSDVFTAVTRGINDGINAIQGSVDIVVPFRITAVNSARTNYFRKTDAEEFFERSRFTLGNCSQNPVAFLNGSFSEGGWDAWFCATHPANNPYGFENMLENEIAKRVNVAVDNRDTELFWANGFISWRGDCLIDKGGRSDRAEKRASTKADFTQTENCYKHEVQTPGSTIENMLGITQESPFKQLELADSVNEIVQALMLQMVNQVMGGAGLFGLTSAASGGSILDRATNPANNTNPTASSNYLSEQQIAEFQSNWAAVTVEAETTKVLLQEVEKCNINSQLLYFNAGISTVISKEIEPMLLEAAKELKRAETAIDQLEKSKKANAGNDGYEGGVQNTLTQADFANAVVRGSENRSTGGSYIVRLKELQRKANEDLNICR